MTASFHPRESAGGTLRTAVILAGGRATRFGDLSALLPKSMFVVSPFDTALSRLLNQLIEARISRIIVSTLPAYAPLLTEFVQAYCRARLDDTLRRNHTISVFSNQRHKDGPIAGLIEVLRRYASEQYLVCLADILFESNPMPKLLELGSASPITVVVSEHRPERGGVVFEGASGHVERFSYKPTPRLENTTMWNWTGTSLISNSVVHACIQAAQEMRDLAPLESLFQALVDRQFHCAVATTGEFHNLNTYDELVLCQQRLSPARKELNAMPPVAVLTANSPAAQSLNLSGSDDSQMAPAQATQEGAPEV